MTGLAPGSDLAKTIDSRITCSVMNPGRPRVKIMPGHKPGAGPLHHSGRVNTYNSVQSRKLLETHNMKISMSRTGNCLDKAVAENFFANLKNELTFHRDFSTRQEARSVIFDYIELVYNR